jgi:hypothetical protein
MPAATSQLQFNAAPATNPTVASPSHVRRLPSSNEVARFDPPVQFLATDPVVAFIASFRKNRGGHASSLPGRSVGSKRVLALLS